MLERISAKNKCAVIKWNGKYICSSVDPVKEAGDWVKKQQMRLSRQKNIIVLGAGCGYHLTALQKAFPSIKILAIDVFSELIEFCKKEHALDLSDVAFECISSIESLVANKKIYNFLKSRYAVLKFSPAVSVHAELYDKIEVMLLGRTVESAEFLGRIRPEFQPLLKSRSGMQESRYLFSIKTLDESLNKESSEDLVYKVKILKELIA